MQPVKVFTIYYIRETEVNLRIIILLNLLKHVLCELLLILHVTGSFLMTHH